MSIFPRFNEHDAAKKDVIERYTLKGQAVPDSVKNFLTNEAKSLSPFEIRQYSKQLSKTNRPNNRVASKSTRKQTRG